MILISFIHTKKTKCPMEKYKLKPCPFGLGLRKFALDPVVVIFFKKCQKSVV